MFIRYLGTIFLIFSLAASAFAQSADPKPLLDQLSKANFKQAEELIAQIAATGDARVVPALEAFAEGDLYARKSDGVVFMTRAAGSKLELLDPLTGESAGEVPKTAVSKVKVNNNLRRSIRTALSSLTLMSPNPEARLQAANTMLAAPSEDNLELIETALAKETDGEVRARMEEARAVSLLNSGRSIEAKRDAIETIRNHGGRDAIGVLRGAYGSVDASLQPDIDRAIGAIESEIVLWDMAQNVWYGLSLGSVLLLAAIGLAITFGVMGIINMAHGEMVMLGAYSTFVVQDIIRSSTPQLFDWSLAIALPVAFLVTAAVGLAIERGVIRFLYGRPLETLLATWGISLILQQAIRSIFGPTNQEVGNPSWMSGSFPLGGMTVTWNRMWIILFSLSIFVALLVLMKKSSFGLQMRAVTQNRRMASSMGIRTPWVDAFTFALGSGIAGIAGVALSQIDNVSPNLGQSYIIDSFMVVVFGGVGNLWGTLVGALSLGVLNKFLEPWAGAVLGKILVLVLIILFIQKRPRGLFALKGRAVEA
ncbi:Putative Branched-chain amino acid ABC transporter (permease protein) [Pseudorhizobium banfieldiae]|uniref:Putative Branched-chain amino acid ABC transporter (Permease protein) n=1 Tax=Pseudorhizobium banfieldiae TaxID=1125847 RepID=L0NIK4_9HYPH|nr:urea ABC transporter permease subunit UrtB [Pseudorhizobium banfieldiae]CAD6618071.1 urea ABC transporter permease subunit UrtB [arsenite-oxidising bacterium NT-25]CCF20943.1 Putative Branched-chain amino acid ABC transporter (permease protein) [Pseudorhizobium banfieldiae]